ncbi:hypothetical protein G647_01107 [Cladophialophora carrionii CBS 160.54]|uniref:Uncharacterized protein n=1 Tax=Cladophialophora carrionii CBS 160.54 TaxID=1279043 RepID=V9DPR3_9EURO|nr:uncharacterized protein G647_01107 [Cladophialophora carrionii CBS 160.54]ETI28656.1 hypothetical protein G647_01107 [Cladophialophora carrionii CBS 160.54]
MSLHSSATTSNNHVSHDQKPSTSVFVFQLEWLWIDSIPYEGSLTFNHDVKVAQTAEDLLLYYLLRWRQSFSSIPPPPSPPWLYPSAMALAAAKVTPATTPSTSTVEAVDPRFILQNLAANGITVKDPSNVKLFAAASELSTGKLNRDDFLDICLPLVAPILGIKPLLDVTDILQSLADDIAENAKQLNNIAEADVLRQRYLGVFETARDLEPESIRIVVAVKEVLEDTFDDHEVTYLQADSASIRDFLREETVPFLGEVENRGVSNVPIDHIRRKRNELKAQIEVQRKNVNVHLQRVERGIDNLTDGTYYIKTNHLPRYAAAAALEILLRGYYVLLGRLDKEDIMIESDSQNLMLLAKERVEVMQSLLEQYKDRRESLLTTEALHEDDFIARTFKYYINDAGSPNDILCPRIRLADLDLLVSKHRDVQVSTQEDGTFIYRYDSITRSHERNKTRICGDSLSSMARTDIRTLLKPDGLVWRNHFQPHVDRIEMILRAILGPQRLKEASLTSERLSKWPKTVPLSRFRPEHWGDSIPHFMDADKKMYYMIYHIAGWKVVGEFREDASWIAYPKQTCSGPKVFHPGEDDYYRCEILVDVGNCEWVPVTDGNPPKRVVDMGENEQSIPFLIGKIFYDEGDQRNLSNAADVHYTMEGDDLKTLRWSVAAYPDNDEVKTSTNYHVLCYEEDHLVAGMSSLHLPDPTLKVT